MRIIIFIVTLGLFLSCKNQNDPSLYFGEWKYTNGFDTTSVYYESTLVRFSENGMYEFMREGSWIYLPNTKWYIKGNTFFMGDGEAGIITFNDTIAEDNSQWHGEIISQDTIKGLFIVYKPPLKNTFLLTRNKTNLNK
uniref:Uncharacterized protein n=1 Tax=uncultured Sphingobacteriales bacterium HF0130_33B19 TaxID=710991 RepID=E0XTR5_9SPHI|nr:hypothetical protein [uncultured Sphingobacteriales bacterium HF0130_33B19]